MRSLYVLSPPHNVALTWKVILNGAMSLSRAMFARMMQSKGKLLLFVQLHNNAGKKTHTNSFMLIQLHQKPNTSASPHSLNSRLDGYAGSPTLEGPVEVGQPPQHLWEPLRRGDAATGEARLQVLLSFSWDSDLSRGS